MTEVDIRETDEYIRLGQALKKAGLTGSGVDAKNVILDGLVRVNGEVETRRGKKLYGGEIVSYADDEIKIVKYREQI